MFHYNFSIILEKRLSSDSVTVAGTLGADTTGADEVIHWLDLGEKVEEESVIEIPGDEKVSSQ